MLVREPDLFQKGVGVFDRIGARWLDTAGLPDAKVVRTCNTPQEYAEALALDAARDLPGAGPW